MAFNRARILHLYQARKKMHVMSGDDFIKIIRKKKVSGKEIKEYRPT